jgi:hypothetical protein
MKTEIRNRFGEVYLTIEYHDASQLVYNNWLGYQTYASIVAGANICLKLIAEHHCPYLLNDNSQVVGPWDHTLEWLTTDWAPRAMTAGLTHFAHIVSPDSFAAFSAHNMHTEINQNFQMSIFDSIIEGLDWLRAAQRSAAQ